MKLKFIQPPVESLSRLGCEKACMLALLYTLSKQSEYATGTSNPAIQVADVILERTLGLSEFKVSTYKKELKELGILDYQIRKRLPTLYRLNLEVMRSEYGYDCFDNYSDVPSAPKEEVAAVTTENKKSKYSKTGYNKKQTSDNSKNNISYSNSSYVFKKPYENIQEKRDKLLEDIKNN